MSAPLAARMRPRTFDEFVGQPHLVAPDAPFRRAAEGGRVHSCILWGPPGVGKTTLAVIAAETSGRRVERLSATSAGVADLRRVVETARRARDRSGLFSEEERAPILFVDEIHRFNKAQQDAILPDVEEGVVALIGATTENPSFEVNSALLSRARVHVLQPLTDDDLALVLDRALADPRGLAGAYDLEPDARERIVALAAGDARRSLVLLEALASATEGRLLTAETLAKVAERTLRYDKGGDQHFDLISALHKSVRGSDPDASVYWLVRMLEAGEDPLYLARRIVRMASEDVGLADPGALPTTVAAFQACQFLGMPECGVHLAQAVIHLALAPKSNAVYNAYKAAQEDVAKFPDEGVPMHLRNAPTKLMKGLGHGAGYEYAHDHPDALVYQRNRPERLEGREYYVPTDRGREARLAERLAEIKARWREGRTGT